MYLLPFQPSAIYTSASRDTPPVFVGRSCMPAQHITEYRTHRLAIDQVPQQLGSLGILPLERTISTSSLLVVAAYVVPGNLQPKLL
jgi:hypothetical protein